MKFREYVGLLTDKEFYELMYAIYCNGNIDGILGLEDSPTNFFSSTLSKKDADNITFVLQNGTNVPVHDTYRKYVYWGGMKNVALYWFLLYWKCWSIFRRRKYL